MIPMEKGIGFYVMAGASNVTFLFVLAILIYVSHKLLGEGAMKKPVFKETIDKNIFHENKVQSAMLTLWEIFLASIVIVVLTWVGTFFFFLLYV